MHQVKYMKIISLSLSILLCFIEIKQKLCKCHEKHANALIKMCVATFISLVRSGLVWSGLV